MSEGTRTSLPEKGRLDEESVKRAHAAASHAAPGDRVRTGLEAMIADAETDPATARLALVELRRNQDAQQSLEAWLGGDPDRATFGVGAVIAIASAELGAEEPDLRASLPEMLQWLEGDW